MDEIQMKPKKKLSGYAFKQKADEKKREKKQSASFLNNWLHDGNRDGILQSGKLFLQLNRLFISQ